MAKVTKSERLQSAIRLGQVECVSQILEKQHSSYDLCKLLHYALLCGQTEVARLLITKYKCPIDCRNKSNETPLHVACKKGNADIVRMLMEHNADSTACNQNNETPLHIATLCGHTSIVTCLIDEFDCSPTIKLSNGTNLLHQACSKGHDHLAETLLIKYNLGLNSANNDGDTPLHFAALHGRVDSVKLLILKYKCLVDCKNKNNETPLHYACRNGHVSIVRVLVSEYKADVHVVNIHNNAPIHKAVKGGHVNVVKYLIDECNCSPSIKGFDCRTLLHQACEEGHVELTEILLAEYGLDPFSKDSKGNTPLHSAAFRGTVEILKLLIVKYKCPVDCTNKNNDTPLHFACRRGHLNVVKTLLSEYKADLHVHNVDNDTPLNEAAVGGHTNVVKWLLDEFHCSPNIKGHRGTSLLHQACSKGHVELAETLMTKYSLDPMSTDSGGDIALHYAVLSGCQEMVMLLITKYNCKVDYQNRKKQTPLHYASKYHLGIVRSLISEHNADINVRDIYNYTPLHIAANYGCADVIQFFIEELHVSSSILGYCGSNILHQVCQKGHVELVETLITHYSLDLLSVDDNRNTPLHLAALKGREEVVNLLITKFKCPVDRRNKDNKSPLDLAVEGNHQRVVNLIKMKDRNKNGDDRSTSKEIDYLLPVIPREGYICAAQSSICIVQMPRDIHGSISVFIESVDDVTLHPKLLAKEFLLTPVVHISSDTKVFSPNKQAVIELLKTTELHGSEIKLILMFSDTHPSRPPQWKDLNPDDFEVLQDRIVFNTTNFSLFTVIARLPTPTNSIKIIPDSKHQEPVELTVSNVKVVIPPSSVKTETETEVKITANFDHPLLCEESIDATACITLEPQGLQFKERIPIKILIPDYAQITEMYTDSKLQFLHSNDPLDSESVNWTIIPKDEYEIIKEGDQYVGIVYSTHFSNRKAVWLNIPRKIKKAIQGPIHAFRKSIVKKLVKSFSGRCQVFMTRESVVKNVLKFGITALLHPLQEFHEIPKNYDCMLYDSEKIPLTVRGSTLKLTIILDDYCCSSKTEKFQEEIELTGDFSARADFNIEIDSVTTLDDVVTLGTLSIKHGGDKPHKLSLIKPKKAPVSDQVNDGLTKEDHKISLVNKPNFRDKGQDASARENKITVHLPSLDSTTKLSPDDACTVHIHLWPARHKWRAVGMALNIDYPTLEGIEMDHKRTDDRYQDMIIVWLRNTNLFPCWKSLTSALKSIEIKVLLVTDSSTQYSQESAAQSGSPMKAPVSNPATRPPVSLPRKIVPVTLSEEKAPKREKVPAPHSRKEPPVILPKEEPSVTCPRKKAIQTAIHQLNTSLNQWESNVITEMAKEIANCTEQMAVYVRDNDKDKCREDFATFVGSIVCESEKLIAIGGEVAKACTEETLKKALQQQSLPKIGTISKQLQLLMKVTESSDEEHGDAILVDNAENLLSAVKRVVEDIQVATIEIKDHSVREKLGLKWVK